MIDLLTRIRRMSVDWVKGGHRKGANGHSVSATVTVRDGQWGELRDWMWENREQYNGITVLPHDGGTYVQAPFEEIDEPTYREIAATLPPSLRLTELHEGADRTARQQEAACAGGVCEI